MSRDPVVLLRGQDTRTVSTTRDRPSCYFLQPIEQSRNLEV